jgi:hypothetical protein
VPGVFFAPWVRFSNLDSQFSAFDAAYLTGVALCAYGLAGITPSCFYKGSYVKE